MGNDFDDAERAAIYRVIRSRRDIRSQFIDTPLAEDRLARILEAAHLAPSVGLSQPWRFILVRDHATRSRVQAAFTEENARAAATYEGAQSARYQNLKLAGILDAPLNICVVSHAAPDQGSGLGRRSMPETALYSTVCAIQNLWLAARAEGVGIGWVSIIDPEKLRRILAVPPEYTIVAYLCIGYTSGFAENPELERAGWETRRPLADVVFHERFGVPGNPRDQS